MRRLEEGGRKEDGRRTRTSPDLHTPHTFVAARRFDRKLCPRHATSTRPDSASQIASEWRSDATQLWHSRSYYASVVLVSISDCTQF